MASALVRVLALAVVYVAVSADPKFSFRGSGQMKEEEVAQVLKMEEDHDSVLLKTFEDELSTMYTSLPKNVHGNVGHQAVRYALHRLFVKRHGWFIRGLEPGNSSWTPQRLPNGKLPPAWVKEWVASFLLERLEHQAAHHGVNLRDLAAIAATIEDLVHKEVELRLKNVYRFHQQSMLLPVFRDTADELLSTYYMTFLLANNLTANSKAHLQKKKKVFARSYRGYTQAHEWFESTVHERLGSAEKVDFKAATQVGDDVGLKYHTFNEGECDELRAALRTMESKKPGRVRLSVLYNQSRYTHWRFTEKPEFLKQLGALDDTDPKQLSLITANYVMARPNCLDASNLYTLCCTNKCEDLLSHLEGEIGSATAPPERIAALVAQLASEVGVHSETLAGRLNGILNEIANYHNGEVPLHSRLFAQYLHHAFPRECPYPHESGSINPQTAEEWSREKGSSEQSSDEERQKVIEDDVCSVTAEGKVECEGETEELAWNPVEELLVETHENKQLENLEEDGNARDVLCFVLFCMLMVSLVMLALSNMYRTADAPISGCHRQMSLAMVKNSVGVIVTIVVVFLVLAALNLLDENVFALALGLGCIFYLTAWVTKRNKAKHEKLAK